MTHPSTGNPARRTARDAVPARVGPPTSLETSVFKHRRKRQRAVVLPGSLLSPACQTCMLLRPTTITSRFCRCQVDPRTHISGPTRRPRGCRLTRPTARPASRLSRARGRPGLTVVIRYGNCSSWESGRCRRARPGSRDSRLVGSPNAVGDAAGWLGPDDRTKEKLIGGGFL